MCGSNVVLLHAFMPEFFYIDRRKSKTQRQNSSQKLMEIRKTQEKTHLLAKFPGVPINMPFLLPNIFNKGKILEMF